ncbi:hypothetical protein HYALB_00004133 [Hymenoscyphus albidus]|uniref:Carboxylic ester hydrolase n=1 Tax=Hymenoscyphus albidus TaxID=595503 RepID=A0A9N9LKY9_9HELO|nr:hypothetical protein HYALB_00004133 [Hymenoscyphus albidus]
MYILILLTSAVFFKAILGNLLPHYTNKSTPVYGNITYPEIPGKEILSITTREYHNISVGLDPFSPFLGETSNIYVCEVNVTLTHPGVNDTVLVQIWLPLSQQENPYNDRFVALGGGGFAAGVTGAGGGLGRFAIQGYAAASTDGGLNGTAESADSWGLNPNGNVNVELLRNLATRAPHDVVTIGKAVTESYYGYKPDFSYWNGCSTGGRQGLEAAQRFPEEFDGILAGAPAVYWNELVSSLFWPQAVMQELADGVKDGVISNLDACDFKASSVVGTKIQCDEADIITSEGVAEVVQRMWDGPSTPEGERLWHGFTIGTPLQYTTNTTIVDGKRVAASLPIAATWMLNFLEKDLSYDLSTIKNKEFADLVAQSIREYGDVIESSNPDLSSLKSTGGKLLVWHGEADQLIPHEGSLQYRQEVDAGMGGTTEVDEFFRLFLAPRVDHCGSGITPGAAPVDAFGALRSWVEDGTAPNEIPAESRFYPGHRFTRTLCLYPNAAKYNGYGNPDYLESFECVAV